MASINTETIKTIFQTMDYGIIEEDIKIVKDWLIGRSSNGIRSSGDDSSTGQKKIIKNKISGDDLVTIHITSDNIKQKIEASLEEKTSWNDSSSWERTKLMRKFAKEIEKNSELICKIESCTRGLLTKDTKKYGVSILIEYLEYFASWSFSSSNLSSKSSVVYASNNTCLGVLGFALGPLLAHGCNVIFHVEPELSPCVTLLIELSLKAGIPNGVLKLVTNDNELWTPESSGMMYLFGDLQIKKFTDTELYYDKKVVAVSNNKIPLIVFENSDLDSVCECAVDAIWEYGGMMPWSVDTILVQENIYEEFVSKLKQRLKRIRVGKGNDKLADISYPMLSEIQKLEEAIAEARAQGIDVYQVNTESTEFQPTLFIGTKVYNNNVLTEDRHSPSATVLAFRTPKEAIALANNSRQGLAASVWCESVSLLNEVVKQLNVGTVWVNSHGIVRASVPFTTYKLDGAGYIGGPQGFYEYNDQSFHVARKHLGQSPPKNVTDAFATSRKAQAAWSKLTFDDRIKTLTQWALDLEQHKAEILGIHNLDEFIAKIYECIAKFSSTNSSASISDLDVTVKRESVGIVVSHSQEAFNTNLVIGALLLGNAVFIVTFSPDMYKTITKFLPPGLLTPMPFLYIGYFATMQVDPRVMMECFQPMTERFLKCYSKLEDWDAILRRCTLSKNIWMTSGDSVL